MSLRQLQNLTCINCGPYLHDGLGCIRCRSRHSSQLAQPIAYDAVMLDFIQRAKAARANKHLSIERRAILARERARKYRKNKRNEAMA